MKAIKMAGLILAALVLLFMDGAAIHDILVGEPGVVAEWVCVILSLPLWFLLGRGSLVLIRK